MATEITVNGIPYQIVKLLGHGKGGYSYLVQRDGREFVVKQIHHEPCNYYTFGDKLAAEQNDYIRLQKAGIPAPFASGTNQVFAIMTDEALAALGKDFLFTEWERVDAGHRMVRFCTSWATTDAQVDALCAALCCC